MDGRNDPGNHGEWLPGEHSVGDDEVLRSGQGEGERPREYPGPVDATDATSGSTADQYRPGGLTEFKTYRYRGWLPGGRIVVGKEIRAAFIVWLTVYVFLLLLFVMAGVLGISLVDFLEPLYRLDEYGLLRLDLISLMVSACVLVCRGRFRLAWRKHLMGGT